MQWDDPLVTKLHNCQHPKHHIQAQMFSQNLEEQE